MTTPTEIRDITERNARMLALKPDKGHLTGVTTARLIGGLRCEVSEDEWRFAADMPRRAGGDETAPTPSTFGRGALASCLVMGIATWAARMDIPIDALAVEVHADFDVRGQLGVSGAVAGYEEVRYEIAIESPAPREQIAGLLDVAIRHSPYVDVFGRAQSMRRTVHHNGEAL